MTGWKLTLSLVCWTVLLSLWGLGAQAAGFAPSLSQTQGEPGDVVEVLLPYDGSWGDIAAFRVDVEYDPQVFEYVRYQGSDAVSQGTVTVREEEGKVEGVFTASGSGPCFTQGEYLILRFRVMENAPAGSGLLFVSLYEISSPGPELVWESVDISLTFRVPEPPSSDARLLSLVPDNGVLDPVFDPDCFSYRVTVPHEVETMTFLAEPAAGALCRVNRKNLGSGGSDTVFTITVTAEDGKTKNVYQVVVHRLEKEEPEYSDDARLLSLVPATGTLEPAFSPETLSYTLTVPFSVTTMTFDAEAVEGATYRVNRKNLGAGGSDTPFTITVTAADGETKSVYQVMVHRQEKSASTNASGGTSASNEGGDSSKPGSGSGGDGTEESGALSENAQGNGQAIVQEQGDPGAAETDFTPAGGEDSSSAGGLLLQNGDSSLLPGMIAMLCFVLFCFLSEPLAKSLAKRFPEKRAADSSEKDPPAST